MNTPQQQFLISPTDQFNEQQHPIQLHDSNIRCTIDIFFFRSVCSTTPIDEPLSFWLNNNNWYNNSIDYFSFSDI